MELFNLDELVTTKRNVHLFGETYQIAERSVGQMITAIKLSEQSEDSTPEEVLAQMIEAAHQIIPDCPLDHIERLNLKQLQALIKFAYESDDAQEASQEEESEGK